jgi:hypothetical protein
MKRFKLVWRRKTNKKPFIAARYEPRIRAYINELRRLRILKRNWSETLARQEAARERGQQSLDTHMCEEKLYGLLTPDVTFNVVCVLIRFHCHLLWMMI